MQEPSKIQLYEPALPTQADRRLELLTGYESLDDTDGMLADLPQAGTAGIYEMMIKEMWNAVVLSRGDTITLSDLPDKVLATSRREDQGLTLGTLQTLLLMIEEKQRLVRLLSAYIDGPGLTIVIGAEHPDPTLRLFSLVASTYEDGAGIGTIGVIGPTRMRYPRAIALVEGAAQAVSRMLRGPN